jgi:hypothetical protein
MGKVGMALVLVLGTVSSLFGEKEGTTHRLNAVTNVADATASKEDGFNGRLFREVDARAFS